MYKSQTSFIWTNFIAPKSCLQSGGPISEFWSAWTEFWACATHVEGERPTWAARPTQSQFSTVGLQVRDPPGLRDPRRACATHADTGFWNLVCAPSLVWNRLKLPSNKFLSIVWCFSMHLWHHGWFPICKMKDLKPHSYKIIVFRVWNENEWWKECVCYLKAVIWPAFHITSKSICSHTHYTTATIAIVIPCLNPLSHIAHVWNESHCPM